MRMMLKTFRAVAQTGLSVRELNLTHFNPATVARFHTQNAPDGHKVSHYYHLPEGFGSIFSFPFSFTTSTPLKRLWHGYTNFHRTVNAIGTHGCKFCACVYVPLNENECFAAHLKAYIHVEKKNLGTISEWFPTAEEGAKLRMVVRSLLKVRLWREVVERARARREVSFVVCPDAVYQGESSTGYYLCQAVGDVFGDIPDKGTGVHGYVVDHMQDKKQILARGPEIDEKGHLVEHAPEEYGSTRRNPFEHGESEVLNKGALTW